MGDCPPPINALYVCSVNDLFRFFVNCFWLAYFDQISRLHFSYMPKKINKNQTIKQSQGISNPLEKRLYTLKEAAFYLGRSEWGMRDLMWKQLIPVVREPGARKVFFDRSDLEKYIEKNKAVYH